MNCTCTCGNCLSQLRIVIREELSQLSSITAIDNKAVMSINSAVEYIDPSEYCARLNISIRKVYDDLKSNKIPGAFQQGRLWRIPVAS